MIPPKSKSQAKRLRDQLCSACEQLIDERKILQSAVDEVIDKDYDSSGCSCHPRTHASAIDKAVKELAYKRIEQIDIEIDILEKDIDLCCKFLTQK